MPGPASTKRRKQRTGCSALCRLPTVPEDAVLGGGAGGPGSSSAGSAWKTGAGRPVDLLASPETLLAAMRLFDDDSSSSSALTHPSNLPTGADWPLLSVLTPQGPMPALVQPDVVDRWVLLFPFRSAAALPYHAPSDDWFACRSALPRRSVPHHDPHQLSMKKCSRVTED